jgi:hypothetical protein
VPVSQSSKTRLYSHSTTVNVTSGEGDTDGLPRSAISRTTNQICPAAIVPAIIPIHLPADQNLSTLVTRSSLHSNARPQSGEYVTPDISIAGGTTTDWPVGKRSSDSYVARAAGDMPCRGRTERKRSSSHCGGAREGGEMVSIERWARWSES